MENKEGEENFSIKEEFLKNIGGKIDEGFNKLSTKLEAASNKPTEDDFSWLLGDEAKEDEPKSKNIDQDSIEKMIEIRAAQIAEKIVDKKLETKTKQNMWDTKALTEFPEANPNHADFDKSFAEEVKHEMERKIEAGRKGNDPTLLYDSVVSVYALGVKKGTRVPKFVVEEERRRLANDLHSNSFGGQPVKNKATQNEISKSDLQFASKLRLSPERAKQLHEKYGFYRKN